ncbi:hypothetical protein [Streptomyces sp. NPDC056387]|uniref:hypothetical protein n=1 Tax=Streptomyces sp. NPDC056387 TaxID=3345803 RepID=UPI0035D8E448
MAKTTDHHYVIAVENKTGLIATQRGVLTLEPIATRAGVIKYLLDQLTKEHGPGLSLVELHLKPNLR